VKPPRFSYEAPASVDEAVSLLTEHGPEAKVLAGGQSLIPLLSFRLVRPSALIDLNRIASLDYVRWDGDTVRIGAVARHRALELDPRLADRCPMILEALGLVGHVAIRNRGTVAGSMAHADPAAEWPVIAAMLDAEFDVVGPDGTRTLGADDFFLGFMTSALQPDEILVEVRITLPASSASSAFREFARRHGDYAQAGAGAMIDVDGGEVRSARIGLLGLGMTPIRARAAEESIIGRPAGPEAFRDAAEAAAEVMEPLDDVHADAVYKRDVGRVMVERALAAAHERTNGRQ
jgi:aerobic carbon-monoxide dehydrogenase medium subunit